MRPTGRSTALVGAGYSRTVGYWGRFAPMGHEQKFFDTARGITTPAVAGSILNASLNLIPQGVTEETRIGRKCTLRSLFIRGTFFLSPTSVAADAADSIRFVVYHDKQANGATATIAQIFEDATIDTFNNLSESGRFRILRNIEFAMSAMSQTEATSKTGEVQRRFKISLPNLNMPIEFSSTTGAITEVRSNNIGIAAFTQDAKAQVGYNCRVRFSDN